MNNYEFMCVVINLYKSSSKQSGLYKLNTSCIVVACMHYLQKGSVNTLLLLYTREQSRAKLLPIAMKE